MIDLADGQGQALDLDVPQPTRALAAWRKPFLIIAIFSANVACALLYDVLPPILPPLAQHFGGGQGGQFVAQMASTMPFFGVMLAGMVAGLMIERQGLRTTLVAGLLVFAVSGSAGLVVNSAGALLATRLVMGFATGVMQTCCVSLIALHYTGLGQARMNGLLITIGAIAGTAFVLISGQMAAHFSWRAPFALHGIVALAFVVPVLLMGQARRVKAADLGALTNLMRLKPALPAYVLCMAIYVVLVMFNVQLAFLLASSGLGAPTTVANIFAFNAAMISIVSVSYGKIAERFAVGPTLSLVFAGIALSFVIVAQASALPMFVCAVLINSIAIGVGLPALWTYAMRQSPPDLIQRALGLVATSLYLGGTLSPILLAPVRTLAGARGQFYVVAAGIAAVLALVQLARLLRLASKASA